MINVFSTSYTIREIRIIVSDIEVIELYQRPVANAKKLDGHLVFDSRELKPKNSNRGHC